MKKFKWIGDNSYPRRGPALIKGVEYDASLYPTDVIERWIAQGKARKVGIKKQKSDNGGN